MAPNDNEPKLEDDEMLDDHGSDHGSDYMADTVSQMSVPTYVPVGPDDTRPHGPFCGCNQPLDIVVENYQRCLANWEASPMSDRFQEVFETLVLPYNVTEIDNVIVMGIGSFCSDADNPGGICRTSDSMFQLVAFETWLFYLRERFPGIKHVYFQNPHLQEHFVDLDEVFVEGILRYTLVPQNGAHALVTNTTFLFDPSGPDPMIYDLLYSGYPGFLVSRTVNREGDIEGYSDWFLCHPMVKNFWTSRNFAQLGHEASCFQLKFHIESLYWVRGLCLYYPTVDYLPNPQSRLYNSSNQHMREFYADNVHTNVSFEAVTQLRDFKEHRGPGQWTIWGYIMPPETLLWKVGVYARSTTRAAKFEELFARRQLGLSSKITDGPPSNLVQSIEV